MNHEVEEKQSLTGNMESLIAELHSIGELLLIAVESDPPASETMIDGLRTRTSDAIRWVEAIHKELIKL